MHTQNNNKVFNKLERTILICLSVFFLTIGILIIFNSLFYRASIFLFFKDINSIKNLKSDISIGFVNIKNAGITSDIKIYNEKWANYRKGIYFTIKQNDIKANVYFSYKIIKKKYKIPKNINIKGFIYKKNNSLNIRAIQINDFKDYDPIIILIIGFLIFSIGFLCFIAAIFLKGIDLLGSHNIKMIKNISKKDINDILK